MRIRRFRVSFILKLLPLPLVLILFLRLYVWDWTDPEVVLQTKRLLHECTGCKCEDVHLMIQAPSPSDISQLDVMLHMLMVNRRRPLQIHHVGNTLTNSILSNLFTTWDLPSVQAHFYPLEGGNVSAHLTDPLSLVYFLPDSVDKIIFINQTAIPMFDVGYFWDLFQEFSANESIGLSVDGGRSKSPVVADIMLIDVKKFLSKRSTSSSVQPATRDIYHGFTENQVHFISCLWGEDLKNGHRLVHCGPSSSSESYAEHRAVLSDAELGARFIAQTIDNSTLLPDIQCNVSAELPVDHSDKCHSIRLAALAKRKTHLYFIGEPSKYSEDPCDVTLVTQLSIDRFGSLEMMMTHWTGPAVVVMYVDPSEVETIKSRVNSSAVMKHRENLSFHLVYKRGKLYPVNYLRNVGINQSHTPYTLFIDVDLVPNPGIYNRLKDYIRNDMLSDPSVVLVVPSFEALEENFEFPSNKQEMLNLLHQEKTVGYRMLRKWNLGHKPTNFTAWETANQIYEVPWKNAFEPYTVVRTSMMPRYHEALFERMGDKIAYGRELFARGHKFRVLPDVFALHLKHPTSEGTKLFNSVYLYSKCAEILVNEFARKLAADYPKVKFS